MMARLTSNLVCLLVWCLASYSCVALVPVSTRGTSGIRRTTDLWASSGSHQEEDPKEQASIARRSFLATLPLALLAPASAAQARGLVQFPCTKDQPCFLNTYHFLRSGTSLLEEQDIWSTNPLFLTNREDALSPAGQEQVVNACQSLKKSLPTVVKYSLAACAMDTANIVGRELRLGRDRLVPEFTFLDPRGIGQWDMLSKTTTQPAIWAMDNDEAGADGIGARPPANTDGTPHETLADQAIRLRQLMSILETQYSGDTILLVFPDGTGPALLSCMIAGIPYNRCHELEFGPGEVRLNVNYENTLELWNQKQNPAYASLLEQGRETLKKLDATDEFVNIKDQKIEQERLEIDRQQEEREKQRRIEQERVERTRLERQRQLSQRKGDASGQVSPTLLGGLGAAAVASLAVLAGGGESDSSKDIPAATDGTPEGLNDPQEPSPVRSRQPVIASDKPPLYGNDDDSNKGTVATAPVLQANGETSPQSLFDQDIKPRKPKDRVKAAQDAMEEYLNQDDGGDAWLQSMSEILEEESSSDRAFE